MLAVNEDTFRHEDGEEVTREIVYHPGAVAVVAHDGEQLYLVAQPREAVGEAELLELPAGKSDEEGESPLDTAKRELAEEIGLAARDWERLTSCYSSPGFTNEEIHVYLATDLYEVDAEPDDSERIMVRHVPLADLDDLIRDCRDAKTLVGLLWLKAMHD
jgi:ADP-ribose diphosphatase